MAPVASYVFLDLETTGLPSEECNKTKITEISMVAVKREHILDTRPGAAPRVQNKLTLCINPRKLIAPSCSDVTGLCNDLLEHETDFNMNVFNLINTFLDVLAKPVCLIAQNGTNFDFPILKQQIQKLNANFHEDILCADCYHAFYDIMEYRKRTETNIGQPDTDKCDLKPEILSTDLYVLENTLHMKSANEKTPRKISRFENRGINKARRRFPWLGSKPKESYKLKDIYERLLNRPALEAHRAENDCLLALECATAVREEFVEWIDNNHIKFSVVKPMTIGVPLGL